MIKTLVAWSMLVFGQGAHIAVDRDAVLEVMMVVSVMVLSQTNYQEEQ